MVADVSLIIEAVDKTGKTFGAISLGAAASLGLAAKSAVDFDTAISGASRALDLSDREVKAFANSAKAIAPALGLAPDKFAQLSAEAGKLGVAKGDIVGFSKNIAELGLITDSTDSQIVELAGSFAAIKTITGATNKDLEEAGAAFNALDDRIGGNVRGITEFVRQTAAAGKLLGLNIKELGAYGATLGALGIKEAVAYRSFNSLLTKLASPQVLSKQGQEGLATLGIASDDLAKRMTTNAKGGIDFFLGRIRDLSKTDVSAALGAVKQVIGADFGDEILSLALASDKYNEALAIANDTTGNAAKKQDELAKKASSVKGQLAIAGATAQVLGINLGEALLPALVGVLKALTPLAKGFADLVAANPVLGKITVGALLLVSAIAPITGLIGGISAMVAGLASIGATISALTGGLSLMGLILASPFLAGTIAAGAFGVVALGIAGVATLIFNNWTPISAFFVSLWGGVTSITQSAITAIAGAVSLGINTIAPILQLGAIPFLLLANAAVFGATQIAQTFALMSSIVTPLITGFVGMIQAGATQTLGNFTRLVSGIYNGFVSPIVNIGAIALRSGASIGYNLYSGVVNSTRPLFGFIGQIRDYIGATLQGLAVSAYNWGASIINQLTTGINNAFAGLVGNLQNQLAYLRSFLPSSDAERGALSDLSRSGESLWQTFATGLNTGIGSATRAIANGSAQLLPSPGVTAGSTVTGQPAGGQTISIVFSPSVSGNNTPDLIEALREESRRLVEMIRVESARLNRGAF